jgi:quercetin dioxygenase-like cupin family protein
MYGPGVHVFDFGAAQGRHVTQHASDFTISRLAHTGGIHVGCMRLGPGGVVGYHQARTHQILAVVEGAGWTRGENRERTPIAAGKAVYWEPGEWHETGTDVGLMAIVIEGDVLGGEPEAIGPAPTR